MQIFPSMQLGGTPPQLVDQIHEAKLNVPVIVLTVPQNPVSENPDRGIDAIMTAHIVNKKLDPEGHPGTLSDDILTGILREKLHFNGVVFSDDMQMHAITKHYGLEDAVRMAIQAGVDIMTFSNNISGSDERTVDKVHAIIRGMVIRGVISEARIDESFDRIMKVKAQMMDSDQVALLKQELEALKVSLENAIEAVREVNQSLGEEPVAPDEKPERKRSRKKNKDL